MITVIQRVSQASVTVNHQLIGEISTGIMALVAIEKKDTCAIAERLLERLLNYRIFADENGKMNLSLRDINGGLLLIPQFTLAANTKKGNRPSFATAASPEQSHTLFSFLQHSAQTRHAPVAFGQFGHDMQVSLINNGPATFTLHI
mgnify:CR=1 FL=1